MRNGCIFKINHGAFEGILFKLKIDGDKCTLEIIRATEDSSYPIGRTLSMSTHNASCNFKEGYYEIAQVRNTKTARIMNPNHTISEDKKWLSLK